MSAFGLIGHPIAHSLSPKLFELAYNGKYPYSLIETPDFSYAWDLFLKEYKAINVTAPFKNEAYKRADWLSPECLKMEAVNICVKKEDGKIEAYNSDYLAIKAMLSPFERGSLAVIGYGGAGRAALAAAQDCGFNIKLYRHDGIAQGLKADIIIYTLPKAVEGIDKLECAHLIEANYLNPCLSEHTGYISGTEWLLQQAIHGYELMTGEKPDSEAMKKLLKKA